MITRLSIQGLAIIDSLSIEFSEGFNVITGETGAGKSILIRALGFLMGAKAGAEAVRSGSAQATVSGEFQVPKDHAALQILSQLGIGCETDHDSSVILIRRTLNQKGRSQSWVNDTLVTSQPLKALGSTLVDVFGQHENQRLMDPTSHIQYLDCFLTDDKTDVLKQVQRIGEECLALIHELSFTVKTFLSRDRSRDYLSFRLEELEKFSPSLEDCERVTGFTQLAEQQTQVREVLARAVSCLEGQGEEGNLCQGIWEAAKCLGQLPTNEATSPWPELRERAMSVARELEDLSFELGKRLSGFEFDEEEVEAAQTRLFGYHELFRKHSVRTIEDLLSEKERLKADLDFLESASTNIEGMLGRLGQLSATLVQSAEALTRAREKAALRIKKRVETELHELVMPGSRLEVEFTAARRQLPELDLGLFGEPMVDDWKRISHVLANVGERGSEKAQFLLASNPGEPLLPVSRVASGGELSRIMLAMKKALAADADTCVLVFDEIDSGISGRVADVVGKKMRELSSSFQVICISHLPQVAVYADAHFLVSKKGHADKNSGRSETFIIRLSADDSAREIARLLSGAEVSTPSLANARSLIERARGEGKGNNVKMKTPALALQKKKRKELNPKPSA